VAGNTRKHWSVKKSNCRIGKIPGGITSTSRTGFSGYKEVVQFMGRSFVSVRQGVNNIADRWERAAKKYQCGKRVVQIAKTNKPVQGDYLINERSHR
jgi:hypothetical protein